MSAMNEQDGRVKCFQSTRFSMKMILPIGFSPAGAGSQLTSLPRVKLFECSSLHMPFSLRSMLTSDQIDSSPYDNTMLMSTRSASLSWMF